MNDYLIKQRFGDINLDDPFFDSLKADYQEFEDWFNRKSDSEAYLFYVDDLIEGFLYFKMEEGPVEDIEPTIDSSLVLKIGTFKINPHGTRLGERFIKKALDYALANQAEYCYVTIFDKEATSGLIKLLRKYGFNDHGEKVTQNGTEKVLVKSLVNTQHDILKDFPLIRTSTNDKFLLAIHPEYHSIMFPDSILRNENIDILEDVSFTNSIHKIYVTRMPVYVASPGDILVIYRTATPGQSAEYSSVATSICVVEEVKNQAEFGDFESFYAYASTYSVFDKNDLRYWYNRGKCYTIKMTYNAALSKRLIRKRLINEIGLEREQRWSFFELTDNQFMQILKEGGVSEGIIID